MVVFISSNTSWTKSVSQKWKGNYNAFSYAFCMWRHPKHERCHSPPRFRRCSLKVSFWSTLFVSVAGSATSSSTPKRFWRYRCRSLRGCSKRQRNYWWFRTRFLERQQVLCGSWNSPLRFSLFCCVSKTCFLELLQVLGRLAHAVLKVFVGSVRVVWNAYKTNAFEAWTFLLRHGVFLCFCCFRTECYRTQAKRMCSEPCDVWSFRVLFFSRFQMLIKPMHLKHARFCSESIF